MFESFLITFISPLISKPRLFDMDKFPLISLLTDSKSILPEILPNFPFNGVRLNKSSEI